MLQLVYLAVCYVNLYRPTINRIFKHDLWWNFFSFWSVTTYFEMKSSVSFQSNGITTIEPRSRWQSRKPASPDRVCVERAVSAGVLLWVLQPVERAHSDAAGVSRRVEGNERPAARQTPVQIHSRLCVEVLEQLSDVERLKRKYQQLHRRGA